MSWGGERDYRLAHIPGAIHLDTNRIERPPPPADSFGGPFPGRPELIVHASDVRLALGDSGSVVVSVRSLSEQLGKTSGYRDFKVHGRIRGDVWGGVGSDANHMEDYENPDGTLKSPQAVAERWSRAGILPEKRVIFYCGTGWRASLAFWDAWVLGWPPGSGCPESAALC